MNTKVNLKVQKLTLRNSVKVDLGRMIKKMSTNSTILVQGPLPQVGTGLGAIPRTHHKGEPRATRSRCEHHILVHNFISVGLTKRNLEDRRQLRWKFSLPGLGDKQFQS